MTARSLVATVSLALLVGCQAGERRGATAAVDSSGGGPAPASLQAIVGTTPQLPFQGAELVAKPPREGWALGMVSWVAVDGKGRIYLLQRGDKADPIVVLDRDGKVLRSWGKGMYTMPHAIRIDPDGNVWTTDAATSMVYKFTPEGAKLLEIAVGGQPSPCIDQLTTASSAPAKPANNFCGTTDLAFAPNGHVFISDGYANNRILEYSADGKRLNEWGSAGTGPGQFRLPHSIRIDDQGVIYVSDRENGRIERFDSTGRYLGEWPNLGRIFSLDLRGRSVWISTQPLELPNGSPGWLLELDRDSGKILGRVDVTAGHGMAALGNGELMVGPGPERKPQWFRPAP